MKLSQKLKIVVVTSLTWTICLSSCAGLKVKWWFLDSKERGALVRKKGTEIIGEMSFHDADGYFCLSSSDAEAAINAIKACQVKP